MKDLEVFTEMLTRAGIKFDVDLTEGRATVNIEAMKGPYNDGYLGFCAVFYFSDNDELVKVAIWE